jgi:hypothetical protein
LNLLLFQFRLRQLPDVVHRAVQVPLRGDLGAPPVIQIGQALFVPDVARLQMRPLVVAILAL